MLCRIISCASFSTHLAHCCSRSWHLPFYCARPRWPHGPSGTMKPSPSFLPKKGLLPCSRVRSPQGALRPQRNILWVITCCCVVGWRCLAGVLAAVRLLSVLAGLGVVGLLYLIGRELFSEKIGLIGALFGALAPFQIHYAQEIRMYVFLALWLLLATYAYLKASRTRRWEWWGIFALSAALAQYAHSLASIYLIPLALTPVFRRDWRTARSVLLSGLAALLLYAPWLIQLPAQIAKLNSAYWLARPGPEKIFSLLLVYTTNLPLPGGWVFPALGIALFALFLSIWQTVRTYKANQKEGERGLWLLYLAVMPVLLSFLISQWQPVFLERSFLASGAIYCLWLAWSAIRDWPPSPGPAPGRCRAGSRCVHRHFPAFLLCRFPLCTLPRGASLSERPPAARG